MYMYTELGGLYNPGYMSLQDVYAVIYIIIISIIHILNNNDYDDRCIKFFINVLIYECIKVYFSVYTVGWFI
jgi:hypothetical protein